MKKVLSTLTLASVFLFACKKENSFYLKQGNNVSDNNKFQNRESGYEEYYQIIDFLESYDSFIQNDSIGNCFNIVESEWLMEAAINMRYGNTTRYVVNLESETRNFEVILNNDDDSLLQFEDMMIKLSENMEWSQNINNKELFFVDIAYIGNGEGAAKFTITKVFGEFENIIRSHNTPIMFNSGESYGAIGNLMCNLNYYGSTRTKITDKINAATGNFGNTQYYNMIWTNIQLMTPPITYNTYCGTCPCSPNMWGVCNKLWAGNVDVCLTVTQMNHYLTEAWNFFTSPQLPTNFNRYNFLVSFTSDGSQTYISVPGGQYYSYKYQYIYVARMGKLINYPPQN